VTTWPCVCAAFAACMQAAAAVGGAPVAVAIGGGAREMQRELGKARVWLAWVEETRRKLATAGRLQRPWRAATARDSDGDRRRKQCNKERKNVAKLRA
jgi:hypothetical protein